MPSLLFHQNMMNFGGSASCRTARYASVFENIKLTLPSVVSIKVAGFTEITNHTTSEPALVSLAEALMGDGSNTYVVACGMTALARGPEFVGISVAAATPVIAIGRILLRPSGIDLSLYHDQAPNVPLPPRWSTYVPGEAGVDYRGLVYIVVTIAGFNIVVGFLHNLYKFDAQRILVRQNIPRMIKLLRDTYSKFLPNVYVYIGGDFNLEPRRVGTIRTGYSYPYHSIRPTTNGGNLYDYWYSHPPIDFHTQSMVVPRAGDYSLTRSVVSNSIRGVPSSSLSDHSAITLRILD